MKKLINILILALSLALIFGAVAVSAFADNEKLGEPNFNWTFTDSLTGSTVYTDDLLDALQSVKAGSTITLLRDIEMKMELGALKFEKDVNIDLGGHTLYLVQGGKERGFSSASGVHIKFSNGTIVAASSSAYSASHVTDRRTHAIFTALGTNSIVELENVNTYGYAVTYSWGRPYTVKVSGGEHHVYTNYVDLTYPGWICGNNNITATVKNANIYLTSSQARLVGFQNYKATASTAASSASFDGCKIIASSADHSIISGLNKYSTVSFKGCDIYGKLAPGATELDIPQNQSTFSSTDKYPLDGAITLGAGCRVSRNVIGSSVVKWADDVSVVDLDATGKTVTDKINVNAPAGYYTAGDFTIAPSSVTAVYNLSDKARLDPQQLYKVVNGNSVKYYLDSTPIATVISEAAEGSTIYLLGDVTEVTDRYETSKEGVYSATYISISKGLTIDLGGHTLTVVQRAKNCGFYVNTKNTVTFRNGTVSTVAHTDYNTSGKTFAFANANVSGANIVFDNVNSHVSSLVYAYDDSYTITVNGGRHNINSDAADMNTSGFISGQNNFTATVNNAVIYSNGRLVIGASSYKALSASLAPNTVYTFNNCSIISTSAKSNLVGNANEFVHVSFNGCALLGSINPSINAQDTAKSIKPASASNFIIGEKTYFSSISNLSGGATVADKMALRSVIEKITIEGTVYEFDIMVDYIYVTWYDENGNVLRNLKVSSSFNSLSPLAPKYEGKGGVTNGWYKIGGYVANAWTTTPNGTDQIDLSTINSTSLTDNLKLYPLANESTITAHLSSAMYNLSTTGAIRNNLYIPTAPENVEITGVYVGNIKINGQRVLYRDYDSNPVYYTVYVINEVGATQFTKETSVTVKYKVNGNVDLEQVYTLSPVKYANVIYNDSLKTEGNSYSTKAYNVVADLVRYSALLCEFAGINNTEIAVLYDKMYYLCSELPSDNALAGSTANVSALSGAGSIAYEASSYEPRWKLSLNSSAKIVDVIFTLEGYHTGVYSDRTNFGTHTYGIEDVVRDENGYITTAYSHSIPIYNIVQQFTITLVKADGSEISGTYDLKSYYTAVGHSTAAADFLKSVVALANSSAAYKFPEGKITGANVADFWECDHAGAVAQQTVVSYIYNFKPHFCQKCDSWLFYYEDYGAVADGKTDRTRATHVSGTNDYEAIYWTHTNANEWKAREELSLGKHVAVVGNSNPSVAKYYYISLPEGRGIYTADYNRDGIPEKTYTGTNLGTIVVATDTSWNGVNLIIDDDAICNAGVCTCVNALGISRKHAYTGQSIFTLDEYGTEDRVENWTGKITSLSVGATNIGYAPGRKMLVYVQNSEKVINLRYGANANDGHAVDEVILVDEFGNIDPSTPVQWDYTKLTSVKAYSADTAPIKVSGLDGKNINATFETYVNNTMSISIHHYVQSGRNITIKRSNATVEGIERFFTEEPANSNVTNKRFAYTFINVSWCSNATIKDMIVMNHNNQLGESGTSQGSYEFNGSDANAVSWINCVTKNMFSDSTSGSLQPYPVYRGLFGTNRIRNMYLKDCYLNSFDAHTGAHNVTIEDSTLEHMNFIGGGDIIIKNVTIYTSNQGMAFNLRTDYGSTWKGDVYVDGLTIKYASTGSAKPSRITLFKGSYENQYWGFDTYVPQNVTINNFHIQAYTAAVTNGVRTETLGTKDASGMKVYYYYALDSLSASNVATESKAGIHGPKDKGDSSIKYDYGTNKLVCTQNLTVTNSVSITLPTGTFWHNMKVTINGAEYKISEKKILGIVYGYEWKKK